MLNLSRGKKLTFNTVTSILAQFVTVICGFVLPRLILETYGSDVNGLVNSIGQFLGIISILDLGVAGVARSNLYKPLAEHDNDTISKIYKSCLKFFRRIAYIFLVYVIVLIFVYPLIINKGFSYLYTATLIGAIFISSFMQYYFGLVNTTLLSADQKEYISNTVRIITILLNTVACIIIIRLGASIQLVKLTTSLIYLLRPAFLMWYVNKHYSINRKITYDEEPIKQKWNGMAIQIGYYVLETTDNIVLTVFSTLADVSIYSVYNMVILGVKNLMDSISRGFTSLMGDMLAKNEHEKLNTFFGYVEWLYHTGTTLLFGCTGVLLGSFVRVYTDGVNDANYEQPLFCFLICLANAVHSLRSPYNMAIQAAGHYKQTQNNYILATVLNIVISVLTVKFFGLIGVAIGTFIAMTYQTIWMAWYISKNIIYWPIKQFQKQCAVDVITVILASFATFKIPLLSISYYSWFIQAVEVFVVWVFIVGIVNLLFYKEKITNAYNKFMKRLKKS